MTTQLRNLLNPKKLLLSKWTAAPALNKEKHFLVIKVVPPLVPGAAIIEVELEAVHSKRVITLAWRDLSDAALWRQGWV